MVSPARAHHIIGTPHFIRDRYGDRTVLVLVLTERVGSWQFEITHAPGSPREPGPGTLEVRVTAADGAPAPQRAALVRLARVRAFGRSTPTGAARAVELREGAGKTELTYPEIGNYVVSIDLEGADPPALLSFPVVVGRPGSPGVVLGALVVALLAFALAVRAVRIKRARRAATPAPRGEQQPRASG